jgi:GMC oxidoreductase
VVQGRAGPERRMKQVVVVGSGASAVHFSLSALERGWRVLMLDVGRDRPAHVAPDRSFTDLKRELDDPAQYFLGERFEGVLMPGQRGEYYGFPPHRASIFAPLSQAPMRSSGFEPLASYARGGLAEAWTGGSFPFNREELADFPFSFEELSGYYDLVAERIGICGADDDLARFVPVHRHLAKPVELDEHSRRLLERYGEKKAALNSDLGCWIGRSRVAVLTEDSPRFAEAGRKACDYLGRCLWGCPRESLYSPSQTLRQLQKNPDFRYRPGVFVAHFEIGASGRIDAVYVDPLAGGPRERIPVDRLVLGAGTLSTGRIFLDSLRRHGEEARPLPGLMDNRQILVPFVNLSMLRKPHEARSYQYHQLALGLAGEQPKTYVHGLITTLKTALVHPIVQSVPFDLRTSLDIFRHAHSALGIVNVNLHDTRRDENCVEIPAATTRDETASSPLLLTYKPAADEPQRMAQALKRVKKALWKLGCIVPPGMTHVRPMGASVHYAGILPMSRESKPRTTSRDCRSHDFDNLWIVDGSTFPFLPAKNLTFTLMANAARVAERAF